MTFGLLATAADIAFLGGVINYVLTHGRWFQEYVLAYTNASTIVAAGDVRRTQPRAGRRARHRSRRLGHGADAARRRRGPRHRDAAAATAPDRRPGRPPGRPADP